MRGQLRLPHRRPVRVRAATSRPPARGRRSPSRTSRWTAPGRCTRRGSACSTATSTSPSCSARASRRRRDPPRSGRSSSTRTTSRRSALDPVSLRRRCRPGRCSTPGKATERDFAEVVARSRRNAIGNPNAQVSGRVRRRRAAGRAVRRRRRCAATTCRRSPTARPRWSSRRGDQARELTERPGVDPRHRPPASTRTSRACATSPTSASTTLAARKAGVRRRPDRRRRAVGRRSARRRSILREALGLADDVDGQPVGRRARAPTRSWPTGLIRFVEARRPDHRRAGANRALAHATGGQGAAAQPRCRPGGGVHGTSAAQSSASARRSTRRRRDDVSIVGLVREAAQPRARRRRADLGRHRRRRHRQGARRVRGRHAARAVPRRRARRAPASR